MKRVLAAVLLLSCTTGRAVDTLTPTAISFSFIPRAPQGPSWEIEVKPDLSGTYRVADGSVPPRTISISPATLKKLSEGNTAASSGQCETRTKNIAQTGKKSITYALGAATTTCTFNYSDDDALNVAASTFQAIADTIRIGDVLKHKHRFDHLGLDAELDSLTESVKSGYAIELQNISPILRSIAEDDEMMSPARRKATSLLTMAGVQTAPSAR